MPHFRDFLLRLRPALVAGSRFSSLSAGILVAMCAGLLLPALVGGMMLTGLRQEQLNQEMEKHLENTVTVLANSLATPVWNFDVNAAETIVNASLLDPQVVRITIRISEPEAITFFSQERSERRLGKARVRQERLITGSEVVGIVEVETDDGSRLLEFQRDRRAYFLVLLGQFVFALALILVAIRYWVLKPLARLTDFSNRLAGGDLEHSLGWERSDEIGHLAAQMDQMRGSLRTSFAEQQAILSNVQVGVVFVRDKTILLANRHAEEIFGYGPGAMRGLSTQALYLSSDQHAAIFARAIAAISGGDGRYEEELRLKHHSGHAFWARMGGCALDAANPQAGSIWVYEDITARKAAEEEINTLAFYDPLTGLPNRRLLFERLKQALAYVARNDRNGALLLIDLDNFKTLNDTLGHDVGDLLLQNVGERLTGCIREGDTVARLGGDEFVVMLENLSGNPSEAAAQAQLVGEKIMHLLNNPFRLGIYEHHCTASIGIALFDEQGKWDGAIDEQLKRADLALYQAKGAGRNALRFFDPEMQAVVMERAALEAGLRDALIKRQFLLYYQVQVEGERRVIGVEALLRWQHPTRGMIPPAEFIPLAEDTGLIQTLGYWVLQTACVQLATWAARPETAGLTMAINVSARQLYDRNFVNDVLDVLEQTGANPHRLKLELTETLLVKDVEDIIIKMSALKERGVSFSLDDFGTGYSSLSYLKRLPLEQLKIDQSFVRDILTDSNDASIARMVVVLAESLRLTVIAEGVETVEQRDFLAQQGCHTYQGYLYGLPVPAHEFEPALMAYFKSPQAISERG